MLCNLIGKFFSLSCVSCFFVFSLFLKVSSSLLLLLKLLSEFFLSKLERSFGPPSESGSVRSSLPVKHDFSQESSLVVFLVYDIEPLVIASSNLLLVHSDDEIAHDSMSLLLHLGHQMLLFTLILLNFDFEVLDLNLMVTFALVKLLNIVKVQFLSLFANHLFPETET